MAANLIIKYDPTGDILYINKCTPYPEQESEELGDDIIVRVNPKTEEIENLEILFFLPKTTRKKRTPTSPHRQSPLGGLDKLGKLNVNLI